MGAGGLAQEIAEIAFLAAFTFSGSRYR